MSVHFRNISLIKASVALMISKADLESQFVINVHIPNGIMEWYISLSSQSLSLRKEGDSLY